MNTPLRCLVGLLSLAILLAGGFGLLHGGLYGLTIFILFPVLLGGLASWVFRPATAGRAAAFGALAVTAAVCSLLLIGVEGLICIAMALPLAAPLGALGGWMVYHAQASRMATRGVVIFSGFNPHPRSPRSSSSARTGSRQSAAEARR